MAKAGAKWSGYSGGHQTYPYTLQNRFYYTIQSMPIINRTIIIHKNRYHIDRKLGQGGFGEVYAARRLSYSRRVAIKIVSLATMHSEEASELKEAFLNEVQMAKRLSQTSRHIVHMYDFDFHAHTGLAFIVIELGQEDLEDYFSKRPPLSSAERKAIWRQLVDIAITLYNRQIVHLDIKPKNLVLFPGNVVKLVDLGIAQKAHRTRVGPNGTIPYSAPEVTKTPLFHQTITTTKADVWSWGAVLYHMTYNVASNYITCYRSPSNQHPADDPNLLDVLRHTLVKDPGERPDTPWLIQHPYTRTF